eukprot:3581181-Rhodomonas_salina.1
MLTLSVRGQVIRGRFLGILAPEPDSARFRCSRVFPEQASAQLRLHSDVKCDGDSDGLESACASRCLLRGLYVSDEIFGPDEIPIRDLACFSARTAQVDDACACPVGNSSFAHTARNISGLFGERVAFSAFGNTRAHTIELTWSRPFSSALASSNPSCRASFTVFQGSFLGVSAGESFLSHQRAVDAAVRSHQPPHSFALSGT